MDKKALISLISIIIIILLCSSCDKQRFIKGTIIRLYDKGCVLHSPNQIPIDAQERTIVSASVFKDSTDIAYILPHQFLASLLSRSIELPDNWVFLKDSIDTWFRETPFRTNVDSLLLEKRIDVNFELIHLDTTLVEKKIYDMLVSDYYIGNNRKRAKLYLVKSIKRE